MTSPFEQQRASVADIRGLFSHHSIRQSWLEIEASLAETQAELGIIPAAAAAEIRAKANFGAIDEDALVTDIARTRAPIVSLARALSQACEGDNGGYVHWGATTQNVIQTGRALLMRQAHDAFMLRFDDILTALADMAEREAETVTVARTNERHALPVTFGFKVAGWIEEWLRHRRRFEEASPRIFSSQWGGAVGAMHAIGPLGPALNERLSQKLGLSHTQIPSRAAQDGTAEYVLLIGLLSGTCAKIARDLYQLMADEIEEVAEMMGDEVVGSSTMPHKVNPKIAVEVIALSARIRAYVPLALEAMQPSHEGDAASSLMIAPMIEELCPLAYEMLEKMFGFLQSLRLRPDNMKRNLEKSGEFLASENAMMALAPFTGRTRAHDIVHHAAAQALAERRALSEVLFSEDDFPPDMPRETILAALNPANYIGLSIAMAHEMAAEARKSAFSPPSSR